jgi:hypothetical protein
MGGRLGRPHSPSLNSLETGKPHVPLPVIEHRAAQTQNKRTQTSMPQVGIETTTPVFERAKTAIVIGKTSSCLTQSTRCLHYKLNRLTMFKERTVIIERITRNTARLWDIMLDQMLHIVTTLI